MPTERLSCLIAAALLAGCISNPLNAVTSERYSNICSVAEQNGKLEVAEEACYRALVNVDWGNLGEELRSEKLYNLARIERMLGKYHEAESLLRQTLEIEEARSDVVDEKIGRRLVELSANLYELNRREEGAQAIERVLPIADQYTGIERDFIALLLEVYGKHFIEIGQRDKGEFFIEQAGIL